MLLYTATQTLHIACHCHCAPGKPFLEAPQSGSDPGPAQTVKSLSGKKQLTITAKQLAGTAKDVHSLADDNCNNLHLVFKLSGQAMLDHRGLPVCL